MLSEAQGWWLAVALFALAGFLLQSWWHRMQAAVGVAVVCSNIYWQWTPNKLLAGLVGFVCAFLMTVTIAGVLGLTARCRASVERRRRSRVRPAMRQAPAADWPRLSEPG